MVREKNDVEFEKQIIKFRVRFDYRGRPKPAKFFFGGKNSENIAEDLREQQMAMWRNIPIQGVSIENIDLGEIYMVYDEEMDEDIAYAPMELMVTAHNLEDLIRFIVREEFRRIEILAPETVELDKQKVERMLFRMNEELKSQLYLRSKKLRD